MRGTSAILALFCLLVVLGTLIHLPFLESAAATSVESDITEDTTWTAANSPYEVVSTIAVHPGVTLIIEPGVEVRFHEKTALSVNGSLRALGEGDNQIIFTSSQEEPTRGHWTNVQFVGGSNEALTLQSVVVTYAETGVVIESSGKTVIEDSRIAFNSASGIHIVGQSNVLVKHNLIEANGNGITTEGATSSGINLVGNLVLSNDADGIYVLSSGAAISRIRNVTVADNYISQNVNGIHMFSNAGIENDEAHISDITISGNFISTNHVGIYLHTHGWYAGYIYDSAIHNNTLVFNEEAMNISSGSNWYSWISDLVISNNRIWANENGISIDAFRTPEPPYKSGPFDALLVENIISANNNTGVAITGDVRANLTKNSVSYCSYGIHITSKDNAAHQNDIHRNTEYGMYVTDRGAIEAEVNAEDNFWGSVTGPFHATLNPDGQGNGVNGDGENLDFYPFRIRPVGYINTQAPVADLAVSPAKVDINEIVTLDGLNSQDDSAIGQYFFEFGDGANSGWISAPTIRHEYVAEGTYDVSLVVMDEFGVRSTKVFDVVTVAVPRLSISAVWDPMAVLSQGQVWLEVGVASDEALAVEEALIHLESDSGGHFDPASGYSDVQGEFYAVFYAPEVSEATTVGVTITVSKEGHKGQSKTVYLSVLSPQSDAMPIESWILLAAAGILVGVVVVVILKRRSATKISRRRKSQSPTRRPSRTSRGDPSMTH